MSNANLCDNCKRGPIAIITESGERAYWLRVPKESLDPSHLTSALDYAFVAIVAEGGDKRHPDNDAENFYWCALCCSSSYPDQSVLGGF